MALKPGGRFEGAMLAVVSNLKISQLRDKYISLFIFFSKCDITAYSQWDAKRANILVDTRLNAGQSWQGFVKEAWHR